MKQCKEHGGVQQLYGASGFYQQYLSVMLIVLAFTIGAFLRGGPASSQPDTGEGPKNGQKAAAPVLQPLSEIVYQDLFDGGELNVDRIDAIAEFLQSHDVKVEFELFARPADDAAPGGAIALALARAVRLSAYLERAHVPAEAVSVYSIEAVSDTQARARLFRIERAHG